LTVVIKCDYKVKRGVSSVIVDKCSEKCLQVLLRKISNCHKKVNGALYVKEDNLTICNLSEHPVVLVAQKGESVDGKHELKLKAGHSVSLKGVKDNWLLC